MGRPKSGKTSIAAATPGTLLIAVDKGYETVAGIPFVVYVSSFETFLAVLQEALTRPDISRIVIDTFSRLVHHIDRHVCAKLGIENLGEVDMFAKDYKMEQTAVIRILEILNNSGRQVVLIVHTKEKTITRKGIAKTQISVDLSGSVGRIVSGEVDATLYYDVNDDPITLKPIHEMCFAGKDELEIGGRYFPGVALPERIVIPPYAEKTKKAKDAKDKRKQSIFQPRPREVPQGS